MLRLSQENDSLLPIRDNWKMVPNLQRYYHTLHPQSFYRPSHMANTIPKFVFYLVEHELDQGLIEKEWTLILKF